MTDTDSKLASTKCIASSYRAGLSALLNVLSVLGTMIGHCSSVFGHIGGGVV